MINSIKNFLFKQNCILCKQSSTDVVCDFCFSDISKQLSLIKEEVYFDQEYDYYHLLPYSKEVKYLLTQLKFDKNLILQHTFAKLIFKWWQDFANNHLNDVDAIAVIPIHRYRYLYRGFNQAEILGDLFAQCFAVETKFSNFKRIKYSKAQAKSSRENRLVQIKNVFALVEPIKAKHLVVFDDVLTTGATLQEFIKTIKQNSQVEKISIVSLVRAGEVIT